jgi:CheY-like chemotaxis protein
MKSKPSILFIEDDATTRKIYAVRLAMDGLPTQLVSSAEEALKILEEQKIDVIITDLMMPKYNGVDLITAVRECDYTKHIPILVFTSGGNAELIEKAILGGANAVLQKHSCPPAKLIEKILELHNEAGGAK